MFTCVRAFLSVHPHVLGEIGRDGRLEIAHVARKRLFTGMRPHVQRKPALLFGSVRAQRTRVWSFPTVHTHMHIQVALGGCAVIAQSTCKRFFSSVNAHVDDKGRRRLCNMLTHLALSWSLACMLLLVHAFVSCGHHGMLTVICNPAVTHNGLFDDVIKCTTMGV